MLSDDAIKAEGVKFVRALLSGNEPPATEAAGTLFISTVLAIHSVARSLESINESLAVISNRAPDHA